jgi:hypothetical protein
LMHSLQITAAAETRQAINPYPLSWGDTDGGLL